MKRKKYLPKDISSSIFHDCTLYSLRLPQKKDFNLILDIDFILEWEKNKDKFLFKVAPAEVVFSNVSMLKMDLIITDSVVLDQIEKEEQRTPKNVNHIKEDIEWKWLVYCHTGEISFWSTGYEIFLKGEVKKVDHQTIR